MLKDENVNLLEKVCCDLFCILINSVNMDRVVSSLLLYLVIILYFYVFYI